MFSRLLTLLSSARLAVVLFFTLAASSVIGTVVQQGLPLERYKDLFGPKAVSIMEFFTIFDMYHSWWFMLLIVLFSLNILACTIRQMPRLKRFMFPGSPDIDDKVFRSAQYTKTWHSRDALQDLEQRSVTLMKSLAAKPAMITRGDERYFFAERGRYSRAGMVLVHASILLILLGGLIGAIWGFNGVMNLVEGEESGTITLFSSDDPVRDLGFDVRCNDFTVEFYETGMPKEYRSDLAIMEDERVVLKGSITVNHPLVYRGMKLCQASYGIADADNFRIAVYDTTAGRESMLALDMMKKTRIPQSAASFAVARFIPENQEGGPAALGVFFEPGKEHDMFWLTKDREIQRGTFSFTLNGFDILYYTGIQVSYDPGAVLVWTGFILLISGLVLSLMVSHKRVWMRITKVTDGHEVLIAADASKNRGSWKERLDQAFLRFQKGEDA